MTFGTKSTLFVPHVFFFWCLGRTMLRYCGIPWYLHLSFMFFNEALRFLSETEIVYTLVNFIFTVCKERSCHEFWAKNLAKRFKLCEQANVLCSNRWRYVLRWRNSFSTRDVSRTITYCGIVSLLYRIAFYCLKIRSASHAEQDKIDAKWLDKIISRQKCRRVLHV